MFTYLVELANRMSKEMEVVIAYSVRKQTPKDFQNYFNHQIKLIEVKNFTRNVSPIRDIKAILEVKKIVKSEKPDFVHMHSSKAGAVGRLAISPKQAKLFYTPHSYAFCKKDETGIKVLFYKMAEKLLGKRRCLTIACSKGEYEASKQVTKKSVCISNGIDIEEMNEIILDEPERMVDGGNLRVCTVGEIRAQNIKITGWCNTGEDYQNIIEKIRHRARDKIVINHNLEKIKKEYVKVYYEGDDCY